MVITKKQLIIVLTLLIIGTIWLCIELESDKGIKYQLSPQHATTSLPRHSQATLEQMIVQYSIDYGINYETSLRIAHCESKMGKYKYNLQGSSAKGIFQFINSTWDNYCDGDVLNDEDNVRCFTKLYKNHPSWWVCK